MKELFYYVDGLPDHSYMKALYRYPQNEFPYEELLQRNLERNQQDPEFELTDTGCTLIKVYALSTYLVNLQEKSISLSNTVC